MGNVGDETTRRSLFGAGFYQTGSVEGSTSAPVAAPTLLAVPGVISKGLMPEKIDGKGFKTWQKKMMFFLTTMKLEKFMQKDNRIIPHGIEDVYTLASVKIWVHSGFIPKGYILGYLIDPLYRVYLEITGQEVHR